MGLSLCCLGSQQTLLTLVLPPGPAVSTAQADLGGRTPVPNSLMATISAALEWQRRHSKAGKGLADPLLGRLFPAHTMSCREASGAGFRLQAPGSSLSSEHHCWVLCYSSTIPINWLLPALSSPFPPSAHQGTERRS